MSWAALIQTGKIALAMKRDANRKASRDERWQSLRRAVDLILAGQVPNPLPAEPPDGFDGDAAERVVSLPFDPADISRAVWRIEFRMDFAHGRGWGLAASRCGGSPATFLIPTKMVHYSAGVLVEKARDWWKTADTLAEAAALAVEAMTEAEVAYQEYHRKLAEKKREGVLA